MYKKIIWISALLFSVSYGQVIFAQDNQQNDRPSSCPCMHKLADKLGLSPEQDAKIKDIQKQASVVKTAHDNEMLTLRNQIKALSKTDKLDEAKLDVLLNQKKEVTKSMIKNKVMLRQQIYNVLNAPQKAKYDEMMNGSEKKTCKK